MVGRRGSQITSAGWECSWFFVCFVFCFVLFGFFFFLINTEFLKDIQPSRRREGDVFHKSDRYTQKAPFMGVFREPFIMRLSAAWKTI